MASNINPNNIDGAYPVAGQDNNSQGFRDNFTNTVTNFQAAKSEIEDLQNNVILKAALTGTTLNNNMNNALLVGAQIKNFSATRVPLATTIGSVTVNYASGHYQTVSPLNGSINIGFTGWPANGYYGWLRLQITVTNVAHTVTLPSSVTYGIDGVQGLDPTTKILTFAETGVYAFDFTTSDGGNNVTIQDLNRPLDHYTNAVTIDAPLYLPSSEDLNNGAAASLETTASYFTTAAAVETATLAAGTDGQIKTFMANDVTAGSMIITVSNAGWKSSGGGTITFATRGSACTLQYINSKWFCIGNNGAIFA